ncbi:inositol polyphosphate 5-phosphatase K-like [Brienomyrus brachyistius]|uniref:inositol polyphosphate 5-phosphatase K-like n=1 Tax=Brienomyrus brachyistius TaxID=42636 RepID=UPI0020B25536|nr:inositol polyphosphate 5-phosphatase K-like [Brienomyrus brachyistius]XP_048838109.1 inositol polyphosphate 5-phosphatase K-like [Brienomyrus brachyistius]
MEVGSSAGPLNSTSLGKNSSKGRGDSFRLHVVTWNVASAEPPGDVSALLQLAAHRPPDLYAIGLQEVNCTPLKFVADLAFEDSWSNVFITRLAAQGYMKVSSIRMQGLLLLLFSRLDHVPFIHHIETTYTPTGFWHYWGNKGGVSVRFSFYGHALCFLNCHLAAHMDYASQRVDEFKYILCTQSFSVADTPHVLDHRLVFWFGDLNFRIADHPTDLVQSAVDKERFSLLWEKDQLTMMKEQDVLLQEFQEAPLSFRPTYKYDLFSDTYDTSGKKRKPAWTDRILWRLRPKAPPQEGGVGPCEAGALGRLAELQQQQEEEEAKFLVKVLQDAYTCCMEYSCSDHKPVVGAFSLELKKKVEVPLVRLCALGEWSADADALLTYSVMDSFPASAWDWIGLYAVGFRSVQDYISYTWVKDAEVSHSDELIQVYVSKNEIPVRGGQCLLGYYSSKMQCIVGLSPPFQVHESKVAIDEGAVPENHYGLDFRTVN